ncbi:MAG: hypothetical protein KA751_01235 [Comamonas sp.]|nr:hypothetical protein [Comamonas sp.]
MTKAKTKAQEPEVQTPAAPDAVAASAQNEQEVTGDGSGEALPGATQEPEVQTATVVQQPTTTEQSEHNPEPEDVIDVFVLCDGSLDGITRFFAGSVLRGVNESLAEANGHWLDPHPAAVEHALANGAPVIDFEQDT